MSSRSSHLLSLVHLCVSSGICIAGAVLLAYAYFPHLRFDLADRIIEDKQFLYFSGGTVLAAGILMLSVFAWLAFGKQVQFRLDQGKISIHHVLVERLIGDFWETRYAMRPRIAIDHTQCIEVFVREDDLKYEESLRKFLVQQFGFLPRVILTVDV